MKTLIDRIKNDLAIRIRVIAAVLIATILMSMGSTRVSGDRLQYALPLLAFGCEAVNGRAVEYAGRFVLLELGIHVPKTALGDAWIAIRPDGGDAGMPSGHTAAAVFGAVSLAEHCVAASPIARGGVLLAAGFVGGSRIENDKHYLWQVIAGALLGWFIQSVSLVGIRRLWRAVIRRPRADH